MSGEMELEKIEKKEDDNLQVQFDDAAKDKNEPVVVVLEPTEPGKKSPSREFSGLSKEELMKFADDPFWVRLRWGLFIAFWVLWLGLLVAAVLIIVLTPKCPPKPDGYTTGILYKVEVPKFMDASGDTQGDLGGVTAKLQYIKELGANFLVLSPILKGLGRMVQAFDAIDPRVGTKEDFDKLLAGAHEAGLKVLLEYSPNTACQSIATSLKLPENQVFTTVVSNAPTFASRKGPKAFLSTGAYSSFNGDSMYQDLNLTNPVVRDKVKGAIYYLLYTLNADGIVLLDASYLVECANLSTATSMDSSCAVNQKGSIDFVREVSVELDKRGKSASKFERLLAVEVKAEVGATDVSAALQFAEAGAQLVLLEGLAAVSHPPATSMAGSLKSLFAKVAENASVILTPTIYPKSHLVATLPWAFGSSLRGRPSANISKVVAALSALLPGAGYIYYGDEINLPGEDSDKFENANFARYMQWTNEKTLGFTLNNSFTPNPDSLQLAESNAMYQSSMGSGETTLKWMQTVAKLRASELAFQWGAFHAIDVTAYGPSFDNVLAFWRVANGYKSTFLVLANLGTSSVQVANVSDLVRRDADKLDKACRNSNGEPMRQTFNTLNFKVALAAIDGDFKEDADLELTDKAIVLSPQQVLALKLLEPAPAK